MNWQFAEAKDNLCDVVSLALCEGPQRITWRDQTVVVLSQADYAALTGNHLSFKDFLMNGPDLGTLDLTRDTSTMRESHL